MCSTIWASECGLSAFMIGRLIVSLHMRVWEITDTLLAETVTCSAICDYLAVQ